MIKIPLKPHIIDNDGIHLHLDAILNGTPVNLLLDTGASRSAISRKIALVLDSGYANPVSNIESFGFGDNFDSFVAEVASFKFYGKLLQNYQMAIFDFSPLNEMMGRMGFPEIDGMLGGDLLKAVDAKLDYGTEKIISGKTEIPVELVIPDGVGVEMMAEIEINDYNLIVFIDTGASKSVFGLETAKRVFSLNEGDLHENERAAIGIDHLGIGNELIMLEELNLGGIVLEKNGAITFDFQNINETYSMFNIPAIDGILGGDILKKLNAVIDYETFELRLSEIKE
jgi:hypothetical protein